VLVPIVLILVVIAVALGSQILKRYSYSKNKADLNVYFNITQADDVAMVVQDTIVDEKAKLKDNIVYFALSTVETYFTKRFYVNSLEQILLFTTDTDVIQINIGDDSHVMYVSNEGQELGYKAAFYEGDTLYIAADYVKRYANFEYQVFDAPLHMQVYTQWDSYTTAELSRKTAVRYQGGIKSDILVELAAGDVVTVLEELENWSKVKTKDSYIGYVQNKFLKNKTQTERLCETGFQEFVYNNVTKEGKINLTFHQVFEEVSGNYLANALAPTKTVNVVAPTWFRLTNSSGDFTSLANASYVAKAHELGVDVWALVTDVDSADLYGVEIDFVELLSASENRRYLINGLMAQVDSYGLDGINIDFEKVRSDSGIHFVQFIRELSIETRKRGVVLSVDNYVPSEYTAHYNRREQGIVADYIIIMGYDEHYVGGGAAGSNASISFVEDGIVNTMDVVPAEKIINAIPFYTRVWESGPDGLKASTLTMASETNWVANTGVTPTWVDECCQNYAEYRVNDTLYQCWLEDVDSIAVKLQVMQSQGIKGVASWKLGLEVPAVWDVIAEYMAQ
ncbi:MAG: SH3 domain-containing protein, partial [Lachnospiraceae bacterium]|nr:SH3 domain-containing protein [Lachnospiraceae bacterium]